MLEINDYLRFTEQRLLEFHRHQKDKVAFNKPILLAATSQSPATDTLILVHGLNTSPYVFQQLAKDLKQPNQNILLPLLDGHGTTVDDMLTVSANKWRQSVADWVALMKPQTSGKLWLGGVSLGGSLALDYALNNPEDIDGLLLFDAALAISAWAGLSRFLKAAKPWWQKLPETSYFRYHSLTTNSIYQVHQVCRWISQSKYLLNQPVLAYFTFPDNSIQVERSIRGLNKLNPLATIYLYLQRQQLSQKRLGKLPVQSVIEVAANNSELLGLAHGSSIISPDDAHLGSRSGYVDCCHYLGHSNRLLKQCKNPQIKALYAETTPQNLTKGLIRRTTYNPFYQDMLLPIKQFIHSIATVD